MFLWAQTLQTRFLNDPIFLIFGNFSVMYIDVTNTVIQIAVEKFSEATVGYRGSREIADTWVQLFNTPYFMVTPVRNLHASLYISCCHLGLKNLAKSFTYRAWSVTIRLVLI